MDHFLCEHVGNGYITCMQILKENTHKALSDLIKTISGVSESISPGHQSLEGIPGIPRTQNILVFCVVVILPR